MEISYLAPLLPCGLLAVSMYLYWGRRDEGEFSQRVRFECALRAVADGEVDTAVLCARSACAGFPVMAHLRGAGLSFASLRTAAVSVNARLAILHLEFAVAQWGRLWPLLAQWVAADCRRDMEARFELALRVARAGIAAHEIKSAIDGVAEVDDAKVQLRRIDAARVVLRNGLDDAALDRDALQDRLAALFAAADNEEAVDAQASGGLGLPALRPAFTCAAGVVHA